MEETTLPLLFDRDYLPKPAYFGARDALAASPKPEG
jgi:hypothetical protein